MILRKNTGGLFVDFDGTLADSIPALRGVFHRFLESHGHRGTSRDFEACNGLTLPEIVGKLQAERGLQARRAELLGQYQDMVRECYDVVPPAAGADALFRAAAEARIPVAVVSSAPSGLVQAWLERVGLSDSIAMVVGGDSGVRSKPYPDLYCLALERTGCAAEHSTAVEDSRAGAAAAVAARLRTYVLGPTPRSDESWPGVAGFVDRLDQIAEILAGV